MSASEASATARDEKALLVQVIHGRRSREEARDSLDELARLAETAGARVVGRLTQRRPKPTAAFLIGEGKLADIQAACRELEANLVVFDNDLSAVQVNNLDRSLGIKVIDRIELILQIFARRARSAEAMAQVEMAQLQYMVSRVPLSRRQQRFRGGIGMRGPGESPIDLRRGVMRRRMHELKGKLESVRQRREETRAHREWPGVCLVGYTNAGKSTMLNALSAARAYVDNKLFATLDTKTRRLHLPRGTEALLSDTVGFIRKLPHQLVASFRSTLEEAVEADILLVVADVTHPHVLEHLDVVQETVEQIGATNALRVLLLNKCDALGDERDARLGELLAHVPDAIPVSAKRGDGLSQVKERVEEILNPSILLAQRDPAVEPAAV